MSKNSSPQTTTTTTTTTTPPSQMNIFKKVKRFSPTEPSYNILCFFCASAILFVSCLFFLDYKGITSHVYSNHLEIPKVEFLTRDGDGCDLFDGNWVWDDESYPLYKSKDCLFLDEGFRCSENGRRDSFYTNWRWQPKDCNLPRFEARLMLERLRNRRAVFVGDSVGRNQWESLLCMLSTAVANKSSIYEVGGRPITKHMGFLIFRFEDYNCTVEYYRAPYLVLQSRAPLGVSREVKMTLKLDQMDWTSHQWKDADLLVFNTGHWWNYEKTIRMGCYYQERDQVMMNMTVETAFRRSLETVVAWIGSKVNMNKTHVFFRTYSPVHFRGGEWNTGGSCHRETLPDLGPVPVFSGFHFGVLNNMLSENMNVSRVMKLDLLNVTNMSLRRKDGHPSIYYLGPKDGPAPLYRQDCSHWCLPGIPDSWNEIMYALFLKKSPDHKSS